MPRRPGRGARSRPGDAYLKQAEIVRRKQQRSSYGGQRPLVVKMPTVTWETLPDGTEAPCVPVRPPALPTFRETPSGAAPGVWPRVESVPPLTSQEPPRATLGSVGASLPPRTGETSFSPNLPPIPWGPSPGEPTYLPQQDPQEDTPNQDLQQPLCPLVGRACLGPDCLWFEPIHQCSVIAMTQTLYSVLADLRRVEYRLQEQSPCNSPAKPDQS
jgi:hypothetical protein